MSDSIRTCLFKLRGCTRSRFIPVTFAAAAILTLFSCGGTRAAAEKDGAGMAFDWNAYKGTSIHVLMSDHPWVRYAARRLSEFTDQTGISVSFEIYPEDQFRVKRTVEMLSGITDIDAFMIMPGNSLSEYYARGWIEPLDHFIGDRRLLWPELDLADFYPSALDSGVRDDSRFSVPILLETSIIAYNKRIFAEYGLKAPTTMDELEAAAKKIYQGSGGKIYGITMRGLGTAATSQWVDFLHSFGGDWVNKKGAAAIDSPEAIKALTFYGKLLREYGPHDAARNGWYESLSVFTRGNAAMIYDGNVFRSNYEDPAQSLVHAEVGYAMLPAGPAGSIPHISNWGLAINSGSRKKEASWLFIQWATSKNMALAAHLEGIPSARKSVWKSASFTERDPAPEWTAASMKSYEAATYRWNPPVIQVEEARTVVGDAIVAAIVGKDVGLAARRASAGLNSIISGESQKWPRREH